jgi:hypothetical protein
VNKFPIGFIHASKKPLRGIAIHGIYASRKPAEARSPKQAGKDGHGQGKIGSQGVGLTGPNWTMTKSQDFVQVF